MWELMKDGPGLMFGIGPGSPVNESGCLAGYLPPAQRIVVTPNNDTFYGAAFVDLGREPVVVQTPTDVPEGHYWVMQIADVFTNVVHTLGSASGTPGGKFLLVGPDWQGEKPEGFIDVIRLPTNYGGVFPRSFAARTPEARERDRGAEPDGRLSAEPEPGGPQDVRLRGDSQATRLPAGVTAEMIAADPDVARPQWVVPERFWDDLEKMLAANPTVGPPMPPWRIRRARCRAAHVRSGLAALLDKPRSRPTRRCTRAQVRAGGRRRRQRLAAPGERRRSGAPTGSAARRPRSSTSWSTTTTRRSI